MTCEAIVTRTFQITCGSLRYDSHVARSTGTPSRAFLRRPMSTTRREFLGALSAAVAYPLMPGQASAAATPTLGLIFPPENYPIPPDAKMLFPSGVEFIGNGVGLPGGMTVQGYEEAVPRVLPRAAELAQKGANVISV